MIAGAEQLEQRIARHAHWRQAAAVLDGRQSAVDPDADHLVGLGENVRIYAAVASRPGAVTGETFEKRLVDGWWTATPSQSAE